MQTYEIDEKYLTSEDKVLLEAIISRIKTREENDNKAKLLNKDTAYHIDDLMVCSIRSNGNGQKPRTPYMFYLIKKAPYMEFVKQANKDDDEDDDDLLDEAIIEYIQKFGILINVNAR